MLTISHKSHHTIETLGVRLVNFSAQIEEQVHKFLIVLEMQLM